MINYISRSKIVQCNRFFGTHWSSNATQGRSYSREATQTLNRLTVNPLIQKADYAVLGDLPVRAEILSKELRTFCPYLYFKKVSSLVENQDLLNKDNRELVSQLYPIDAIERAETLLKHIGPLGAYPDPKGVCHIRKNIASFLQRRDGYAADPDTIFLTQGAGEGIYRVLQILHQPDLLSGVMLPIPQYPIYTATLQMIGAEPVPYYLDEKNQFSLSPERLYQSVRKARSQGITVHALAVINPGNPTGHCLSKKNIQDVIQFCQEEHLAILADEVYQDNVFQPLEHPFHSFKKVLRSMGPSYDQQELFSFHSISKGMVGECGRRGGYLECVNVNEEVVAGLYKLFSIFSGSNLQGQIMVDLMTNPPQLGDPSHAKYIEEIEAIQHSYARRAQKLTDCFNQLEGVTCRRVQGAMYLFPHIQLPPKAIARAKQQGIMPDTFYSMALLNATGICVVPGSGFGQEPGSFHIRCSFLPEESLFEDICSNIQKFHKNFIDQYK
ncbi:pyridoxal phosphate-dependent transferase [Sporodiniella umbellata]|nr:pyridoxal phosphate-dependent transferase [Sporodiniella umbellata]